MTSSSAADSAHDSRREAWRPPNRPEWLRLMNAKLTALDLKTTIPLDEYSLIGSAIKATGLDDFGPGNWRERFSVLCRSLDEDAELNAAGRFLTRNDLVQMLVARLKIEQAYKSHPEIEDEEIADPLLIIGQGRSGTSFLVNLLAEDPNNRAVMTWEAMHPAAAVESDAAAERAMAQTEAVLKLWHDVTPELASVHEFTATVPTESIQVMALDFVGDWIPGLMGQVASFQAYAAPFAEEGIRYEKRVLKLLQWRKGRRRWILKSPSALYYLPQVLSVYPDLRLVWAHRDPLKAMSSVVSLQGTLNWVRSDRPFGGTHEHYFSSSVMGEALANAIGWLEAGVVPADRMAHIQYDELTSKPVETAIKAYNGLGLPVTMEGEAAFREYINQHPRKARPDHRYEAGSTDQVRSDRVHFKRYQDYFGVRSES